VKPRRGLTGLAVLAVAACLTPLLATPASADTTPPWEPDTQAIGTLTFYDASGNVITAGSNVHHLFAYAVASSADPAEDAPSVFANLQFANPIDGPLNGSGATGNFAVHADQSTAYPNASAPGALASETNPMVSVPTTGADLFSAEGGFAANTTAGYQNVFQVRVYTSGGLGGGTSAGAYWDADVQVSGTDSNATWVETYPSTGSANQTTSTAVTFTPTTSAQQGTSVQITATETGADSTHPAGSIEIDDGNQEIDSGTVDSNGVFSTTTTTLLPGTHNVTATFTPSVAGYSPSTSPGATYLINPKAATPTVSGTAKVGGKLTCKETTTSGETVAYEWLAGTTKVGSGATLTVPASALNKTVTCKATVSVSGGSPSSATSAGKKIGIGASLHATTKPKLSGPGKAGKTEKVSSGKWSPSATSYAYQWELGGKPIHGATKSSFKIPSKDKNKKLSCKVTAKKTGYTSGSATTSTITVKK
jgi:hypothetical protein